MLVELTNIAKIYSNQIKIAALRNVSLRIAPGEFLAIIGASGSGKSTLLQIIGLLDRPSSGQFLFESQEVSKLTAQKAAFLRNRKIGFVFQSFHLIPRLSAFENIELPLIYAGESRRERQRRVEELLGFLGLSQRACHKPNELSGGEQQRVAIARALANDPALILADEPTGNLDSKTGQEVVELLVDLNRQGKTLVAVTHNEEIAGRAGRIIRLQDGRIVQG